MKRIPYIFLLLTVMLVTTGCPGSGGGDGPELPGGDYERLVGSIRITSSYDDDPITMRFAYDGDQRLVRVESLYDGVMEYAYDLDYTPGTITVVMDDGDDEATLQATLNSTDRITQIAIDWGNGDEESMGIEYQNGRLRRFVDSDDYEDLFQWSGGNIASASYPSEGYSVDFDYTDRPNRTNIDLVWFLGGLGGSSLEEFTPFFSDYLGERCADLLAGWEDVDGDAAQFDYQFDAQGWPKQITVTWYYEGEIDNITTYEIAYGRE